jgi:hypothetical protein
MCTEHLPANSKKIQGLPNVIGPLAYDNPEKWLLGLLGTQEEVGGSWLFLFIPPPAVKTQCITYSTILQSPDGP